MISSKRVVLAGVLMALSLLSGFLVSLRAQEESLILEQVYEYNKPSRKGDLTAFFDPGTQHIFLTESSDKGSKITIIDWKNDDRVLQENYLSHLPCEGDRRISRLGGIPSTPFIYLSYCGLPYLLDKDTFSVVRSLREPPVIYDFTFSPTGEYLVIVFKERTEERAWTLYRTDTWEEVAVFGAEAGSVENFTPDGKYLFANKNRYGPPRSPDSTYTPMVECGMVFYEVPSGKVAQQWRADAGTEACNSAGLTWYPFLSPIPGQTEYRQIAKRGSPYVIFDVWNGRVLCEFQKSDVNMHMGSPSISADGRYLVTYAWDDPQDSKWSRDFIIWDTETGKIVFQTPKYRSVWGPEGIGKEVYARFSSAGNYLIVTKEKSIEIFEYKSARPK